MAWGGVNRPMAEAHFGTLRHDILASLENTELFVQDCVAGADPEFRLPIRVITEYAWHNLFARNLFIVPAGDGAPAPEFTIIDAPGFRADPARHGTGSDVVIALNFAERLVLIGGTSYAGEIKKSVFTMLNYLLPLRGVLPMHCSANVGAAGDVALFFGLSGTGKTTLSSDPDRRLIGDDEHGWSDRGVFNFEGGCYAKTIRLSAEAEPQIYATTRRFGTVLENVVIDETTPRARSRRRSVHREHARGLSDLVHRQRRAVGPGRPSDEHRHADGRRVRRAAADLAADAGRGDVSLPVRLHREGGGHREGRHRAEGDVQHLFRRAVSAVGARPLRDACSASGSPGTAPASGW